MQTLTEEKTIYQQANFSPMQSEPVIMDTVQYRLWLHFISEFALIQSWLMAVQTNHSNTAIIFTEDFITVIHDSWIHYFLELILY